ncbi:MAG: hypothetical protein K8T20_05720 [Planctomycetes bacterium]|nr:hypothetical protein [Planctomycetota bacterium]
MKSLLPSLALAALLTAPAFAGDADWAFKKGQTYTYECKTEFHYVAVPVTATVNGQTVRRGGGFTRGGTTAQAGGRRRGSSDPQWETIRLRATVLDVDKDGTAWVDFMVETVSIDTRFDDNGDRATWSSADRGQRIPTGYRKYAAIVGCSFEARITTDGTILELDRETWPQAPRLTDKEAASSGGNVREENAASAAHDPTPARAWLSLIFSTTPDARDDWKRSIKMPFTEKLDFKPNGMDLVGKTRCVRSQFKTSKEARERVVEDTDPLRGQTLEAFSMSSLRDSDKKGYNWFSRDYGVTMKAEMATQTSVSIGGTIVSAMYSWEVALKDVGKAGPMAGPALPADWVPAPMPVETKEGGKSAAAVAPLK